MKQLIFALCICFSLLGRAVPVTPSCDIIYVDAVAGNNTNSGYAASPVQNLWRAMQLVSGTRLTIRMTGGTYTEPNLITMLSNVVIDGRWVNASGIWTKSSGVTTLINFSAEETINTTTVHRVGIKAFSVNNWVLQDLNITTTNVLGTASAGQGKSNYGILINSCSNYTINRCAIIVGNASAGVNGTNGTVGNAGGNGAAGGNGDCDNESIIGNGGAAGNGGGNSGAPGTNVDNSCCNVGQNGTAGAAASGAQNGGNGGSGASGGSENNGGGVGGNGGSGGGGAGGTTNGTGGPGGGCGTDTNRDGRKGADGAAGTVGTSASGTPPVTNSTFGMYWIPNGISANGTNGYGGGGGKGGGGGAGQGGVFCTDGAGSGGGGGGGGGQGGNAGTGGYGGGGAFGIYRISSTTGAVIQNVTITLPVSVANGGAAGTGGAGGTGGTGGIGGGGNNTSLTGGNSLTGSRVCGNAEVGAGGRGGNGGAGGAGGNGQPGATGRNEYMVTDGTLTNPTTTIPNPTTLTMDYATTGTGCTNSEIIVTRAAAGTWAFTGSPAYIDDMSNGVSSYNSGTSPAKLMYTANGVYDITTNGGTYAGWIRIIDNTRPSTVAFSISSRTVCSGTAFTISAPAWGTELAYDWALFTSNANSPALSATTQTASFTAPVVTSTTTFNIRYRVRESCCGWSKPYYTSITVNPPPLPFAGSNSWTCESGTYSLATASASNAASVSWATSGNGSFNNTAILNPVYTPGSADISAGTVTLTLNGAAFAGCSNASDQIVLSVVKTGTWLGVANTPVNDNWNNTANWCGGIPTQLTDAIIPTTPVGPFWPTIGALNAEVRDLTLQNGTTLTYYLNNQLSVYRTLTNNASTINLNQGKTRFAGNLYNGTVAGSSATNFYDAVIDKTAGTRLILSQNTTVSNNLNMITGDIELTGATVLELGTSAANIGSLNYNYGTSGTVLGRFKRWFSPAINSGLAGLFPVGVDLSGTVYNRWSRVDYTNAPNPGGSLTMRFVPANPLFYANMPLNDAGLILTNLYIDGYWEATAGATLGASSLGNYNLALRVNGFTGVANLPNLRIIKSPPPHVVWTLDGSHLAPTTGSLTDAIVGRTGLSGFSWFSIASDYTNLLPIELSSFHVSCQDNKVNVNWKTATEQNNALFIIERSQNAIEWEEVLRVPGAGNSMSAREYSATDAKPLAEISYYRIKQVDVNGAQKVFMSSSVSCKTGGGNSLISYPNPTADYFILELNLNQSYNGHIEITDALGRTLKVVKHSFKEGKNVISLPAISELKNGLYYVKVVSDGLVLPIQKMLISR